MRYLVDANVLSEPTKPEPSAEVIAWLRAHEPLLVVNPVIVGEVRYGIARLRRGRKRARLEAWFDAGIARLECLPIQRETGLAWALLLTELRRAGRAMPVKDSLIAATALEHDLTVATRNVRDFRGAGVRVVDPFA